MPVLAISGQQARAALGGHYQQELDLVSLFKDVAGVSHLRRRDVALAWASHFKTRT
ncbi:hypothetical protein PHLH4_26420 [Pseudomonas sp. St316]|nr:hypothetical protein PHLH4_26420 [Pseudomonas sp. St316]